MEEPWDQFTTNTEESNSYVRFYASDIPFSFLMVPEDRGVRFLKHTGCPRRNVPDFGRVFLMLKCTDITQNTYIQS